MDRKAFIRTLAALPLISRSMTLNDLKSVTDAFGASKRMPVLFIGHGNPMNAIQDNNFTKSLAGTGSVFKDDLKPKAILVVSAHWLSQGTFVNVASKPQMIYDFGGFPEALSQVQYPAPGSPEFAKETAKLNPELIKETEEWGFDHGSWTILKHMFPLADIPVFQMSIDYYKPMQYHFDLAAQLKPLRDKGVLIVGSGNIVHNLGMSFQSMQKNGEQYVYDWATEFDTWAKARIDEKDFKSLTAYDTANSKARLSVPTPDHYIPMLYSLGLADANEMITHTYEEMTMGAISMRCFKIG